MPRSSREKRLAARPWRELKPAQRRELKSLRATRSWATRRADATSGIRETFKVGRLDEEGQQPNDFGYTFYGATHPVTGEADVIALWKTRLRPYYGQRIKVTLNGYVVRAQKPTDAEGEEDDEGETRLVKLARIFVQRVAVIDGYADVFGPGGLYSSGLKAVRERWTKDDLRITSLTVELAADADDDAEQFSDVDE